MSSRPSPVNLLSPDGHLREWLALGPFANFEIHPPLADGTARGGLDADYLGEIGGESRAVVDENTTVALIDDEGQSVVATAEPVSAQENGSLDLVTVYPGRWFHVAYAFSYLESDRDRTVYAYFGSNDSAKVWVNGEVVHRIWHRNRAARPWTDRFLLPLRKGINSLLVKVETNGGDWLYFLEAYRHEDHPPAVRRNVRALGLHVGEHVWASRARRIPVMAFPEPRPFGSSFRVRVAARRGDAVVAVSSGTTGQRIDVQLPPDCRGVITMAAEIDDDARSTVKPASERIFIGPVDPERRQLLERFDALEAQFEARGKYPEDAGIEERLLAGLTYFARTWLATELDEPRDRDLEMLADFAELAGSLEASRSYLSSRGGRLHAVKFDGPHGSSRRWPNHYYAYLPEGYGKTRTPWPMVVFLHGAGESGCDIVQVLRQKLPARLVEDRSYPFVVVVPQCRSTRDWLSDDPDYLDAFLDEALSRLHVDPDRVILTGLSMGGRGCWDWAIRRPERFAAAVPVCGRVNPTRMTRLADLPLWVFQSDTDGIVPVHYADLAVAALERLGAPVRYTIYPGIGHDAWEPAYRDPALIEWMLAQRRAAGASSIEAPVGDPSTDLEIRTLDATPWLYCEVMLEDEVALHAKLYGARTRVYGLARTRHDLPARDYLVYRVMPASGRNPGRVSLEFGLPISEALSACTGLRTGTLPPMQCAVRRYQGPVQAVAAAFETLEDAIRQQGLQPTGERRHKLLHLLPESPTVELELLAGIR